MALFLVEYIFIVTYIFNKKEKVLHMNKFQIIKTLILKKRKITILIIYSFHFVTLRILSSFKRTRNAGHDVKNMLIYLLKKINKNISVKRT